MTLDIKPLAPARDKEGAILRGLCYNRYRDMNPPIVSVLLAMPPEPLGYEGGFLLDEICVKIDIETKNERHHRSRYCD